MLKMFPKSVIINNIVDTLHKDPEGGVVTLLEKLKPKEPTERALLAQVVMYYQNSTTAKMQIRNLVYNSTRKNLFTFIEHLYDAFSNMPIVIRFMRMITMNEATNLKPNQPFFPMIDLKNLNDPTREVLAQLKTEGQVFFASIVVTEENFEIVTSDEVVLTLVKCGVRGVFYRMSATHSPLEAMLLAKIQQLRTERPILAFFIKKDPPNGKSMDYILTERIDGVDYRVKLQL